MAGTSPAMTGRIRVHEQDFAAPAARLDRCHRRSPCRGRLSGRPLARHRAFLALKMGRPIFLEGEAGVGKTEIAKVLSSTLGRRLIRLQCYEGLDVAAAVYEWNYAAQMIAIRVAEAEGEHDRKAARTRRVLRAISDQASAVAGARARYRRRAGASDRRNRPHRRGVRSVPPRSAWPTFRSPSRKWAR